MSDYIPTLADICSAIAEGLLDVDSDGLTYQVTALELRRHFDKRRSRPALLFGSAHSSSSLEYVDTHDWLHIDLCGLGL